MRDNHFEQRGRSLHKFGRFESTVNSTTDAIDPGIDGLAVLSTARIAWPEKRLQDQRDGASIQRQHHHNERLFEQDEITVIQMVLCSRRECSECLQSVHRAVLLSSMPVLQPGDEHQSI